MQPVTESVRRDPAPSRWAYRFQRLWLTPVFRALLRVGVPVFLMVLGAGWFFSDPDRQQQINDGITEVRRSVAERPEFMVKLMAIDGASAELAEEIRKVLPVDLPKSSFDLDLDEMQARVETLDAVATVDLHIRAGGVLQVEVQERVPAVIWRVGGYLELLDDGGRRVAALTTRRDRPDLPLLAGEGADRAVPEALALLRAAKPLEDRLRGLVRMGERRWDVVLDRGQRILLPETNPVDALEQVIAVHQAQELLERDLAAIDMRNIARPTLRMEQQAVEELRRIRGIVLGDATR